MDVISNADHSKISPFIKFIWVQHQLASSTAFRWQYCLSSAAKFLSVNNIFVRKQAQSSWSFQVVKQQDLNCSKTSKNEIFIYQTHKGLRFSSITRGNNFFFSIKEDTFQLKDFVKINLKIILEDNLHSKLVQIIHYKNILNIA